MKKITLILMFCMSINALTYSETLGLKEIETLESINKNLSTEGSIGKVEATKIEDKTGYSGEMVNGDSIISELKNKNIRTFDLIEKEMREKIAYHTEENQPFTGVFTILVGETLEYLETYKNGKLNGETAWFSMDGKKTMSEFYENGKLNGEQKSFYKDGPLKSIVSYSNDRISGIVFYDKQGKELHKSKFSQGTGVWKFFWENGKLSEIGNYKNWKKNGLWKKYDEEGKMDSTIEYRNGSVVKQSWD